MYHSPVRVLRNTWKPPCNIKERPGRGLGISRTLLETSRNLRPVRACSRRLIRSGGGHRTEDSASPLDIRNSVESAPKYADISEDIPTSGITKQSMRSGRATALDRVGGDMGSIRKCGRWNSQCFLRYIWPSIFGMMKLGERATHRNPSISELKTADVTQKRARGADKGGGHFRIGDRALIGGPGSASRSSRDGSRIVFSDPEYTTQSPSGCIIAEAVRLPPARLRGKGDIGRYDLEALQLLIMSKNRNIIYPSLGFLTVESNMARKPNPTENKSRAKESSKLVIIKSVQGLKQKSRSRRNNATISKSICQPNLNGG